MSKRRLGREDRRRAILSAVMPVFAERGFAAATTRELARAAGVSEALLYRHFPSKEALYAAITAEHLADRELHPGLERLAAMPPSTERLALTVEYLVAHVLEPEDSVFPRLMAQSLLGDGAFARTALRRFEEDVGPFLEASMDAAHATKDLGRIEDGVARQWWIQHLAFALRVFDLPPEPVIRYGPKRAEIVESAVRFLLRGLGLSSEAIARCYKPGAWKRL